MRFESAAFPPSISMASPSHSTSAASAWPTSIKCTSNVDPADKGVAWVGPGLGSTDISGTSTEAPGSPSLSPEIFSSPLPLGDDGAASISPPLGLTVSDAWGEEPGESVGAAWEQEVKNSTKTNAKINNTADAFVKFRQLFRLISGLLLVEIWFHSWIYLLLLVHSIS